jgi:hypothetical protein
MPEQLLDGSDVVPAFEQVRRKAMSKRMARRRTGDAGGSGSVLDRPLENGFVKMMPPPLASHLVHVEPCRGKRPLPPPFTGSVGVLRSQRARQRDAPPSGGHVRLVLRLHAREMIEKHFLHRGRQHRHSVLTALAVSNRQLAAIEVEILHAKLGALEQPESRRTSARPSATQCRADGTTRRTLRRETARRADAQDVAPARSRSSRVAAARAPRRTERARRSVPGSASTRSRHEPQGWRGTPSPQAHRVCAGDASRETR